MATISIRLTELQKRLLILLPAGLVFVWIGWVLAARPAVVKIGKFRTTMLTAGERTTLITEIQSLKRRQAEMESLLATEEARHEILGKLTSLAKQSGFELQSLTPSVEQAEPYGRLVFDLKAQASFPSLIWFLSKVRDSKPGVAVYDINMTRSQTWRRERGAGGAIPQIELTLETYLK